MLTFAEHIEYRDYMAACRIIESGNVLNEGILDKLSSGIKSKLSFFQDIAKYANRKLDDLLYLFKDSRVFKFFSAIKFSFQNLWKYLQMGFKAYTDIQKAIAGYLSKTKVGKWTEEALLGLNKFLQSHPKLKRVGGVAVAGLLLYIWLNMSFTGDFIYDFDFSDLLNALRGKFDLAALFSGTDGTRLLLLFATGLMGLGFPWPGPTHVKLVTAVITGLTRLIKR